MIKIHPSELEPGSYYLGAGGEIRELVRLETKTVFYRLIKGGTAKRYEKPNGKGLYLISRKSFALWALREVETAA